MVASSDGRLSFTAAEARVWEMLRKHGYADTGKNTEEVPRRGELHPVVERKVARRLAALDEPLVSIDAGGRVTFTEAGRLLL